MSLLETKTTSLTPEAFLAQTGTIFTRFDQQDSGNISYGVASAGRRCFVKTAGDPDADVFMPHAERVAWLDNAARLSTLIFDPVLPPLLNVITSPQGPLLVYEWADGELLRATAAGRADPASAYRRFQALPLPQLLTALNEVLRLHARLHDLGWVASDFYDGAIMYDFARRRLYLVDLDHYRPGPFRNDMGRMFGSSRFMAPEEFELGATIDQRTTVYNLGRCLAIFLGDRLPAAAAALPPLIHKAGAANPDDRFATAAALFAAWTAALGAADLTLALERV